MARHAAGDRVDGEADAGAAAFQLVRQLADLVLGLRQRHAVAGDDDDVLGLRQDGWASS